MDQKYFGNRSRPTRRQYVHNHQRVGRIYESTRVFLVKKDDWWIATLQFNDAEIFARGRDVAECIRVFSRVLDKVDIGHVNRLVAEGTERNEVDEVKIHDNRALFKCSDNSVMPFGHFIGRRLGEIPASYLVWLCSNHQDLLHSKYPGIEAYILENSKDLNVEANDEQWLIDDKAKVIEDA